MTLPLSELHTAEDTCHSEVNAPSSLHAIKTLKQKHKGAPGSALSSVSEEVSGKTHMITEQDVSGNESHSRAQTFRGNMYLTGVKYVYLPHHKSILSL